MSVNRSNESFWSERKRTASTSSRSFWGCTTVWQSSEDFWPGISPYSDAGSWLDVEQTSQRFNPDTRLYTQSSMTAIINNIWPIRNMDCFSAEMNMSWVKVELISCLYRRWQCFKNTLRLMTSPVRSRRYWEWVKRIEFRWKRWIILRFALKRRVELIVLEVKPQVSSYLLRRRACSLCVMLLCGRSCWIFHCG